VRKRGWMVSWQFGKEKRVRVDTDFGVGVVIGGGIVKGGLTWHGLDELVVVGTTDA
jgi:hypothetical protein